MIFLWFHLVVGPAMDYGSSWENVDLDMEMCVLLGKYGSSGFPVCSDGSMRVLFV